MKSKALAFVSALILLIVLSPLPVAAQTQPSTPHAFYGTLTYTNGSLAGTGRVVTAFVGGVQRGSITTTEMGKYGDANPLLPKLIVQGVPNGSTIEFYVDGTKADQTYAFESGQTTQLNLSYTPAAAPPPPPPTAPPAAPPAEPPAPPPPTPAEVQSQPPAERPAIIAALPVADSAPIIAALPVADSAPIIAALTPTQSVPIIAALTPTQSVPIIAALTPTQSVPIITALTTAQAMPIMTALTTAQSAPIIDALPMANSMPIMTALTPTQSAGVLALVSMNTSISIMTALPTANLTAIVSQMTPQALTQRLSEIPSQNLFQIPPAVLLGRLPQVRAEYLVGEFAPAPAPGQLSPVATALTPTINSYNAPLIVEGWNPLVGSPVPITKLLVKFARELQNVRARVESLSEKPAAITASLPSAQKVHSYTSISLENVTPADVIVGHLTFKVEKSWLSTNKIHKWSVTLNRYDEASQKWESLPTKRGDEDAGFAYYSAIIPKFSVFAVSGSEEAAVAEFTVSDLTITPGQVATGQNVTISARVTNISTTAGTYTSTLWVNSTVEQAKTLSLAAGTSIPVSFTLTKNTPGTYEVRLERLIKSYTVLPSKPATFSLSDLSVSPAEVEANKAVAVSVKVTNVGEESGTYTVRLLVNQAAEATREVTLAGGASTTVSFSVTKAAAGDYEVATEKLTARFKVLKPPKPAEFAVSDIKVSPAEVKAGEAATISVKVDNKGETKGTYTVKLLVNQAAEASKEVTLDGGASTTVSFAVARTAAATYEVAIEKLKASFKVLKPASFVAADLQVSPAEVKVRQPVTISVKVTNEGEVSGSYSARLLVDDAVEATKEVTVAAGASATVSFTVTKEKAATYKVAIEKLSSSFVVTKPMNWVFIIIILVALAVIAALLIPRLTRKKSEA